MKLLVIPVLMILLLMQTFSKWMIIVEYELNREYIAANLCENKDRPETKCGGKCQMNKKLEADEEKSSTPQKKNGTPRFQEVLFNMLQQISMESFDTQLKTSYPLLIVNEYPSPTYPINHPPS